MTDSWLKLAGNILIAADEYVQFLNTTNKTEPVRSDAPKKTGKASDLSVGICRPPCNKPIHLTRHPSASNPGGDEGPYWTHSDGSGPHCTLFATPTG